jgi:Na+-transporting methylmalonyl-CoA/oxaloacetate decarboxylase gamma subunit
MDHPLLTALTVSGIGLLALFLALLLLYGLMLLMTTLLRECPAPEAPEATEDATQSRLRAAAIAVALARAAEERHPPVPAPEEGPSPWRQVHLQRALNRNPSVRSR